MFEEEAKKHKEEFIDVYLNAEKIAKSISKGKTFICLEEKEI